MTSEIEFPVDAVSANRAEELGSDVWPHFVVPPFYSELDRHGAKKPRVIVGGRGCGKTMLLRYFSHESTFSTLRPQIPDNAHAHVGLYWRTDTQFASAMWKRDISEDTWENAFSHMAAIVLSIELLQSLRSIAKGCPHLFQDEQARSIDLQRLKAFDPSLPVTADDLIAHLEERLWSFEAWVSNARTQPAPVFLPGSRFLGALVREVRSKIRALSGTTFYVYVDEYENLRPYQKKLVNTWLKHSESPLIFNLAMKRNSFTIRSTTGSESLSEIHDFRTYDLESFFVDRQAKVFFAEILFLRLTTRGFMSTFVDPATLRDPSKVPDRQQTDYVQNILRGIQEIFPDLSHSELARNVFEDLALKAKLKSRIKAALKRRRSNASTETFFRPDLPEASIVTPALLHRRNRTPEEVAGELNLLAKGESNRFTHETGWIHNNFVAGLIQLYEPHNRACPFFAGFRAFRGLARGNIRHFLELCHKSIQRQAHTGKYGGGRIGPDLQAEAARQASTAFLREISSFGPSGHRLHAFVLRLGSLFALAHLRPSLSESEQSHFSIGAGGTTQTLTEEDEEFLSEAVKWSVLFAEGETKRKETYRPESIEYVLNPIYAPYFHITYRKKRKLTLTTDEVIILMRGSYDDVSCLLKDYADRWKVSEDDMPPPLFAHLSEDQ